MDRTQFSRPSRQNSENTSNVLTLPNVRILYKTESFPNKNKYRLDSLVHVYVFSVE